MSAGPARGKPRTGKPPPQTHTAAKSPDAKMQVTPEQMRLAQLTEKTGKRDEQHINEMVRQLREITDKEDDEIYCALHDCDNDFDRTMECLLDQKESKESEWQESTKKKKHKAAKTPPEVSAASAAAATETNKENKPERTENLNDRPTNERSDGSVPPRRGRGSSVGPRLSRGGPPRDRSHGNRESDEWDRGRGRGRGQMNGSGRGRGGRRGGIRRGDEKETNSIDIFDTAGAISGFDSGPKIDTWTNDTAITPKKEPEMNTWTKAPQIDDWNEEWSGSLTESKVFTPSSSAVATLTVSNAMGDFTTSDSSNTFSAMLGNGPPGSANTMTPSGESFHRLDLGALGISGLSKSGGDIPTTTSSSDQFMSQYAKQATESIKNAVGIGSPTNSASPTPLSSAGYILRSKQTKKLPPPSKIPSSAVEMPKYTANDSLGVQFGNLDFGNDNSFGFGVDSNYTSSSNQPSSNHMPGGSVASSTVSHRTGLENSSQTRGGSMFQGSGSNTASPAKDKVNPPEPIPFPSSTGEHNLADQLSQTRKSPLGVIPSTVAGQAPPMGYQSNYNAYASSNMSAGFDNSPSGGNSYNAPSGGSNNLPSILPPSNSNGQYGHSNFQSGSYVSGNIYGQSGQPTATGYSDRSGDRGFGSAGTGQGSGYQTGSGYRDNTSPYQYQTQGASQKSANLYGTVPSAIDSVSSTQSSVFSGTTQANTYQNSISKDSAYSVTTSSSGVYQNNISAASSSTFSTGQSNTGYQRDSQSGYGSYGTSDPLADSNLVETMSNVNLQDSSKTRQTALGQSPYEVSSSNSVGLTNTPTTSVISSSVASSIGVAMTTVTSSTGLVGKTGQINTSKTQMSFPPGMPLLGQNYIMGSTPYFTGIPQMYSYEDMQAQAQLLQQQPRLPMAGYFDMSGQSFQTQTSLATGRDPTSVSNVSYSAAVTDASKVTRMDSQSPSQGTQSQSQQQQNQTGHQTTAFINPAMPPYYYYPSVGIPGGFQYTPNFPLVNQVPTATNAQGTSAATAQYQKPSGYGSHAYGTGYDELGHQSQDFSKAQYGMGVGVVSQTQKVSVAPINTSTSVSDLTGASYTKAHPQTFDKQGFATNTPPPYNMQMTGASTGSHLGTPANPYGGQYVAMNPMNMLAHQPGLLHHPLPQDTTAAGRTTQQVSKQNQPAKSYSTGYWGN